MSSSNQEKPIAPGPLEAAAKMKAISKQYDEEMFRAKETGRPIAYLTSVAPVEILQAFDILVAMPENYAALCASRKMAGEFCDISEQYGYSGDICSYVLSSFGSEFANRGPYDGESLPDPDLLVCTDHACNTFVKWWQNLSEHYRCPLFTVDAAYTVGGTLKEEYREYFVTELKGLVSFLEEHTAKKLDMDRLRDILVLSDKASRLWLEIGDYRKTVPAPVGGLDIFTLMLPLVLLRGTQTAVDFYQEVLKEVKERVAKKIGAVPDERFRIIWDTFPLFHRMRLLKYLEDVGVVVATDLYGDAFSGRFDPADPLGSLAERYMNYYACSSSRGKAEIYKKRVRDWHIDGIIYHSNRACRFYSAQQTAVAHILEDELGLPSVMFEGNMTDPRGYSEDQVLSRLQAFIEMMEVRKYGTVKKKIEIGFDRK